MAMRTIREQWTPYIAPQPIYVERIGAYFYGMLVLPQCLWVRYERM